MHAWYIIKKHACINSCSTKIGYIDIIWDHACKNRHLQHGVQRLQPGSQLQGAEKDPCHAADPVQEYIARQLACMRAVIARFIASHRLDFMCHACMHVRL